MRIILNADEFTDTIARARQLLDQAETEHRKLRALRNADRDGFPTSSMGGAPGGPTNIRHNFTTGEDNPRDGSGELIPQHSDPVGRLVVERDEHRDPVGNALAQLVQHVHTARRELEVAVGAGRTVVLPKKPEDPDEIWCENCLKRAGVKTPREEGRKVCRWCREERAEHGAYPSRRLIEAHGRGRITSWHRAQLIALDKQDVARIRAERKKAKKQGSAA